MIPHLDYSWCIASITEIELLGMYHLKEKEEAALRNLLQDCLIIDLNKEIREMAISLRQRRRIKLPDAVIAATSLWLQMPLLTADRDFMHIPDLDLLLI